MAVLKKLSPAFGACTNRKELLVFENEETIYYNERFCIEMLIGFNGETRMGVFHCFVVCLISMSREENVVF